MASEVGEHSRTPGSRGGSHWSPPSRSAAPLPATVRLPGASRRPGGGGHPYSLTPGLGV